MWSTSFRVLIQTKFDFWNRQIDKVFEDTIVAYLFQSSLCKSHTRREIAIFSVKFVYFPKKPKSLNF